MRARPSHSRQSVIAIALLFGLQPVHKDVHAAGDHARIDTEAYARYDYYPWLGQLSRGPVTWKNGGDDDGHAFRAAVLPTPEWDTLIVEEVRLGESSCCLAITAARRIDSAAFMRAFGFTGNPVGIDLRGWRGDDSVEFCFRGELFVVAGLKDEAVDVTREGQRETCVAPSPLLTKSS